MSACVDRSALRFRTYILERVLGTCGMSSPSARIDEGDHARRCIAATFLRPLACDAASNARSPACAMIRVPLAALRDVFDDLSKRFL